MPITCPDCHQTSQNPMDELHGYCANCFEFTSADRGADLNLYGRWTSETLFVLEPPLEVPGRVLADGTPLKITCFNVSQLAPMFDDDEFVKERTKLLYVLLSRTLGSLGLST
jgi:hypothetical protein